MVAEGAAGGHCDGGFQAEARRPHSDGELSPAALCALESGGVLRRQAPKSQRRLWLVAGVLGVLLAAVAFAQLAGRGGRGGLSAVRRGADLPVVLDGTDGANEAALKKLDEEACSKFDGFLKSDCMVKREKDRNAPKYWNAMEVRNGLWKTEKALADLEIRQYKHGRERAMMHAEHEQKLDNFKERMEVAMTLINEIQNEMGTRHSQLVERLKADIISTQARLKKYLDDGAGQVNGKLAIVEEREAALTERLVEMVKAQYMMLNDQVDAIHAQEVEKNENVHAFVAGAEAAEQAGTLRLELAINATRSKFEVLKAREIAHYSALNSKKDAQARKQAADVLAASTKLSSDVSALRANLSATLLSDKAGIRSELQAGWVNTNESLATLASDAEAAAVALDNRLSVQKSAQDTNNREQDALISALESDLQAFNLTVFDQIIKMEGNATRFEEALAAAESVIQGEQEVQRTEILGHINNAIAAVERVHQIDKGKTQADVGWMKPRAAKVAQELQEAIAAIEAQRQQDLAVLTGKLADNISAVNATYQAQHAAEKGKAERAVQALALMLAKRRGEMGAVHDLRVKEFRERVAGFTGTQEQVNAQQGSELAALRVNFTAEAALRVARLLALETKVENVRGDLESTRARLIEQQNGDMALAKTSLSATLSKLSADITDLLRREVATTDGSMTASFTTLSRSFARLDARINEEDTRLNASSRALRQTFEVDRARTQARLAADMARVRSDRARWDADTALGTSLRASLGGNITANFHRLDSQRVVILASLKWDLAAGLARVSAGVAKELAAVEGRQSARLADDRLAMVALLSTLSNLQVKLDANATAQVQELKSSQETRDASHSQKVQTLENGLEADKADIRQEISHFNDTFRETVERNTQTQAAVKEGMETDESAMRESFALSLEDMRARIDKLIARHNTTELEELETRMREVLMKVSELGWRLGARGANLRAVVEEVSEEQERLFGLEAARLQQIKEEEVRAYQEHTEQLSMLGSRVSNEENQLNAETLKLQQDLLAWDASARKLVPPAVEAIEARVDANLRAQGTKFSGALGGTVSAQLARAQAQRSAEEATLAQLAMELKDATDLLDAQHIPEEDTLIANANTTVDATVANIKDVLDRVAPVLSSLQTRLALVYDNIRAEHAAAQSAVTADVQKGVNSLGGESLGAVSQEKVVLEALVAENMAPPEQQLSVLEAKLNALDNQFRNAMSAEKSLHGELHDATRVRLSRMERELRESNANLTSYVSGLQTELDGWKSEGTRALSKLEEKQGSDKEAFLQRLLSTKSDVMKALQTLRMRFQMDVSTLVDKIAWAQGNLTKTHTELQSSQANDKLTIRRDVKTGVGSLEQQTLTELNTDGDAEKSNIQSIISAKELLVNQLARSTDVLILALRNRVRLATGKEDSDNTAQENQLKSNDGTVQKWIRERDVTEDALESKLARIEERVKRRQERAGAEQTILVAQLASRLQRQVQWLNSTFTSENSGLVTSVQGSLSQKVAVLDKTLAFVRRDSLAKLTAQKVALAALDKEQKDAVQALQDKLLALQAKLADVEAYSRGRTSDLKDDTVKEEANLRKRVQDIVQARKDQTLRIKDETQEAYQKLQDDWTRRVETQRDWLSKSIDSRSLTLDNRLKLSSKIEALDKRLSELSENNDQQQGRLKQQIAAQEVNDLAAKVTNTLEANKAAVTSFNADTAALAESTRTQVDDLERQIGRNQGIATATDELLRTLEALKRDVAALQTQEGSRDTQLRASVAQSKTAADATAAFLSNQLDRLDRLLSDNSNARRVGRVQSQAQAEAYMMRMDRYRADLTRINNTWNSMDAGASPDAAAAPPAPPPGAFGAPPPTPDSLVGSDGRGMLNAWCGRFRDSSGTYALEKQIETLEKCYNQDCEQSLEGGHVNRPDRPGCRFTDANGFCYASGAGQIWCRDNGQLSPACKDGGIRWAPPPLGIADGIKNAMWTPMSGRSGAGGKTINCACMKNCKCSSGECRCFSPDVTPTGTAANLFTEFLQKPIRVESNKDGVCDCKCGAA